MQTVNINDKLYTYSMKLRTTLYAFCHQEPEKACDLDVGKANMECTLL